jgi:hypothetical protein
MNKQVRLSNHDQEAVEIAQNLMKLIRMVETRTDNLLKHLNEGGYPETAEKVYHASVDARATNRRLLGEAQTSIAIVDYPTWERLFK